MGVISVIGINDWGVNSVMESLTPLKRDMKANSQNYQDFVINNFLKDMAASMALLCFTPLISSLYKRT